MFKHNVKFKENLMEGLINDALSRVTASQWKNYCHHVLNEEQVLWEADNLQDDIEPLIVRLTSSSSSTSPARDSVSP